MPQKALRNPPNGVYGGAGFSANMEFLLRLRLFIHGESPLSARALSSVNDVVNELGAGRVHLEVVDVAADRDRAEREKVLATPALVRVMPLPVIRIVGDMRGLRDLLLPVTGRPA